MKNKSSLAEFLGHKPAPTIESELQDESSLTGDDGPQLINPCSGLPELSKGAGVDVGGNVMYACDHHEPDNLCSSFDNNGLLSDSISNDIESDHSTSTAEYDDPFSGSFDDTWTGLDDY